MKLQVRKADKIEGTITISGSKNASLPAMVTSLFTKDPLTLLNVPNIIDVKEMLKILNKVGVKSSYNEETKELKLKRNRIKKTLNKINVSKIRASYYLMGALFSLKRSFKTTYPGGCNFGSRPINFHLDAFKQMGGIVNVKNNLIKIKRRKKLPTTIILKNKSLGTTINIIFASIFTKGITSIVNASVEPEVINVVNLLNDMNASIKVKENVIVIKGVKKLCGTTYKIIPDRIEAGSYMMLAASVKQSNLLIKQVNIKDLKYVIEKLKAAGLEIIEYKKSIRVIKHQKLKGMKLIADFYPNFPTDLQQIACSMLLSSNSLSLITDLIYPKRFSEVLELLKMNANLYLRDNSLLIFPSILKSATVYAQDLRAGFSLIVASATGDSTIIDNAEVILRGYDDLINKLNSINLDIKIL